MLINSPQSQPIRLDITGLNILMNILELQIDLHFKPLHSIDSLQVSNSPRLNMMLLNAKQASKTAISFNGISEDPINLDSKEISLLINMIRACIDLRAYLGLNNDCLLQLLKRLGVDPIE